MRKIISVLLSAILTITLAYPALAAAEITGRTVVIFKLEGDDASFTKGTDKKFSAKAGTVLSEGYTTSTGGDTRMHLKLDDDSIVTLNYSSSVSISKSKGKDFKLSLLTGEIAVNAEKQAEGNKVEIKAGNTIMGILGTLFVVKYGGGELDIKLFEGALDVNTPVGLINLEEGHALHVSNNAGKDTEDYSVTVTAIDLNTLNSFTLEILHEYADKLIEKGILTKEQAAALPRMIEERKALERNEGIIPIVLSGDDSDDGGSSGSGGYILPPTTQIITTANPTTEAGLLNALGDPNITLIEIAPGVTITLNTPAMLGAWQTLIINGTLILAADLTANGRLVNNGTNTLDLQTGNVILTSNAAFENNGRVTSSAGRVLVRGAAQIMNAGGMTIPNVTVEAAGVATIANNGVISQLSGNSGASVRFMTSAGTITTPGFTNSDGAPEPAALATNYTWNAAGANWKNTNQVVYSITYNNITGASNPNPATYTSTAAIPLADAAKPYYTFAGWFDNAALTGTAVTAIPLGSTGNKAYYARWTPTTYTITYVATGGTNNPANADTYTFETPTFTLTHPTPPGGYTFGGWFAESTYTTPVSIIHAGSSGNITLYAKWSTDPYVITYQNVENATNNNPLTYDVDTPTITLLPSAKDYFIFRGWYNNSDFAGNAVTQIQLGSTGNITLWAKWEAVEFPIDYELDGGTNDVNNPTLYTYDSAPITLAPPTKIGSSFDGWFSDAGLTQPAGVIPTGSFGAKTFYAKWGFARAGTFAELQQAVANAPAGASSIHLTNSIAFDGTITIPSGKNITLVGDSGTYTLTKQPGSSFFEVAGALTLGTVTLDSSASTSFAVNVPQNGTFTMQPGAAITGGSTAVNVASGGTFLMEGGTISGTASQYGAVNSAGTFTMDGGTISNNTGTYVGAGGVYVSAGTFTMTNGFIQNNTAAYGAGGVFVVAGASFVMQNGTVAENSTAGVSGRQSGGVLVEQNASFTMSAGSITNNTAITNQDSTAGNDVCVSGTFTMSGGTISGNAANGNGSVLVGNQSGTVGTFTMSGASAVTGGSVALANGTHINVSAPLTAGGIAATINMLPDGANPPVTGAVVVQYATGVTPDPAKFTMSIVTSQTIFTDGQALCYVPLATSLTVLETLLSNPAAKVVTVPTGTSLSGTATGIIQVEPGITLNIDGSLAITNFGIINYGDINISGMLTLSEGTAFVNGAESGSGFYRLRDVYEIPAPLVVNLNVKTGGSLINNGKFTNMQGSTVNVASGATINNVVVNPAEAYKNEFSNYGHIMVSGQLSNDGNLENHGIIDGRMGGLITDTGNPLYDFISTGKLSTNDGASFVYLASANMMSPDLLNTFNSMISPMLILANPSATDPPIRLDGNISVQSGAATIKIGDNLDMIANSISVAQGASLDINTISSGPVVINSDAAYPIANSGALTLSGSMTLKNAAISNSSTGTLTFVGLVPGNRLYLDNTTVINDNNMNIKGTVELINRGAITNTKTLDINDSSQLYMLNSTLRNLTGGVITNPVSSDIAIDASSVFSNFGSVVDSGTMNIKNFGRLSNYGTISGTGSIEGQSSSTVESKTGGITATLSGSYSYVTLTNVVTTDKYSASDGKIVLYFGNEKEVTIPSTLDSMAINGISQGAFKNSESITKIHIPASILTIADGAFEACAALTEFSVDAANSKFEAIGGVLYETKDAAGRHALIKYPDNKAGDTYSVNDGVNLISGYAFYGVHNLVTLTLPPSLFKVGSYGVYGGAIKNIFLQSNLNNYSFDEGGQRFLHNEASVVGTYYAGPYVKVGNDTQFKPLYNIDRSSNTITQYNGSAETVQIPISIYGVTITTVGSRAFDDNYFIKNIVIPEGIVTIGENAFSGTGITTVSIPASVAAISGYAFVRCIDLTAFTVASGNLHFESQSGVLFEIADAANGGKRKLISYPIDKSDLTTYSVPNGVVTLGDFAFNKNKHLTSVTLPDTVKEVGFACFDFCDKLLEIVLQGNLNVVVASNMELGTDAGTYTRATVNHNFVRVGSYSMSGMNTGRTSPAGIVPVPGGQATSGGGLGVARRTAVPRTTDTRGQDVPFAIRFVKEIPALEPEVYDSGNPTEKA